MSDSALVDGRIPSDAWILSRMRDWLEKAVIGLNLCPFAKGVHTKGQIHWAVTHATGRAELLVDLGLALEQLRAMDPVVRDTTVLVVPDMLQEFWDFNDFQREADRLLRRLGLEGILQIASFHPEFEFVDEPPGAITHYTNRSPYPALHLLREASIERAVQAYPMAESIYEKNQETMRNLGHAGWGAMGLQAPIRAPHSEESK